MHLLIKSFLLSNNAIILHQRLWRILIKHVILRTKGTVKKCFWLLVVLGLTGGLIYNFSGLLKRYLSYPVTYSSKIY